MLLDFGFRAQYKVSIVNSADALGTGGDIFSASIGPCEPSITDELLRIEPQGGPVWYCALRGFCDQSQADGVYPCPSPHHLLAVVKSVPFYIDSRSPGAIQNVQTTIQKVQTSLHFSRLFLFGFGTIVAIGEQGILWTSPRLSPEDICILAIGEDIIFGHGDETMEEHGEFKISAVDGTLIQGNCYTDGKDFDIDGDINAIKEYFTRSEYSWEIAAPADKKSLAKIELPLKNFSAPYWEFLRICNGGEGVIPVSPGYFRLWNAEELEETNKLLQTELLGLYAFGSSGGGCYYVFDMKEPNSPVYVTEACSIGDPDGTDKVAETFQEFLQLFGTGE